MSRDGWSGVCHVRLRSPELTLVAPDGLTFRLVVTALDGPGPTTHFERRMNSQDAVPVLVDLGPRAGRPVAIALVSDAGPRNHTGWDWAAWIDPTIVIRSQALPE